MLDISKAFFESDGDNLTVTMPIAKIDQEKRIVSGFATLDNVDRHGDIITAEASKKAFSSFKGNVRLMHQPIPAGKLVSFKEQSYYDNETGKTYNGIFVDAYISKGAQNIWEMVTDGTLTSFSIGGRIKKSDTVFDKEVDSSIRVVTDYELQELSLVDSPANQLANIFSVQKDADGVLVADGIFNKSIINNVYWCESDGKAVLSVQEEPTDCVFCNKSMVQIGWIDTTENDDINKSVSNLIKIYNKDQDELLKAENVVTSDDTINKYPKQGTKSYVQWNSSGGTARGKVVRVVRNGKVKVPGTSFTLNASEDEPVALVRVYRKDSDGKWKPTDKVVGHKMKTLRSWAAKLFKNKDLLQQEDVVEKASENVADHMNEGGVEVADNLEVEMAKSETETEEVVVDEIVDEVTEIDAAEELVDVAKSSDEPEESQVAAEEVEKAEDASSNGGDEVDELQKSIEELKGLVKSVVEDGVKSNADAVMSLTETVGEFVKSTSASIQEINNSKEEINKALAEIREVVNHVHSRVEALEEDTAVKKSEDYFQSSEEISTVKKSLWGGRFLGTADILS